MWVSDPKGPVPCGDIGMPRAKRPEAPLVPVCGYYRPHRPHPQRHPSNAGAPVLARAKPGTLPSTRVGTVLILLLEAKQTLSSFAVSGEMSIYECFGVILDNRPRQA